MADLAALLVKKDQLIDQIANLTAAVDNRRRALARAESDLKFTTDPGRRGRLEAQISELERDVAAFSGDIPGLNQQLTQVNNQINQVQQQQAAAKQSTGQTVKEDQVALAEGANAAKPPAPDLKSTNGRVGPAAAAVPSNAEKFTPDANEDAGTAAPVRKASQTQQTPQSVAAPGGTRPGTSGPQAANSPGAAAAGDDNPGGTGVRARLNNLFGGANNRIVAQPNVLDQYSSYTYNISLYIMSPADYKKLLRTKKRNAAGFQLLMSSGGAPVAGGTLTAVDPQEAQQAADGNSAAIQQPSLGRNQFFPLDYYIDDVQVKSIISGKGTGGAHNVTELKFKIIEPNGITFLDNLFAATQQYIALQGGNVKQNYAAQNFLMVIRFYGYDENGTLVTANRQGKDAVGSDVNATVEKFIPFQFTAIKFRIANKLVEYDCSAVCPQNIVATGPARGVIPYNVEVTSQTLKELLTGTAKFATGQAANSEGRQTPTQTNPGGRNPANSGFLDTNEPVSPFQVGA